MNIKKENEDIVITANSIEVKDREALNEKANAFKGKYSIAEGTLVPLDPTTQCINFELNGESVISFHGDGTIKLNPKFSTDQAANVMFERVRFLWANYVDNRYF